MTMIKASLLASLILAALTLSACGQTGPLYLPDDKKAAENTQP